MSNFWSTYIIAIVVLNIVGCVALLYFTRKKKTSAKENSDTTGHVYDGIEEYDNPLPLWWLYLFYITIIFSVVYLILYPGLGKYKGYLNWSASSQYVQEVADADEKYLPLYQKYAALSVEELQNEPEALSMGKSVFVNVCYGCHGADGRGSLGYPNLTDNDWLYGGTPEQIKLSILNGRNGVMASFKAVLSDREIDSVSNYISSKNEHGRPFVKELVADGEKIFNQNCAACHGANLKGNVALGAPNLTDNVWLHGASPGFVKDVIKNGRINRMPAHEEIIGKDKAHLVTAYVYSLSRNNDSDKE